MNTRELDITESLCIGTGSKALRKIYATCGG
jgi:hypothetical protein